MRNLIACLILLTAQFAAAQALWLEGEQPATINLKPDTNGSAKPHLLSDGKWLTIHMEGAEADKHLPAEGALLTYKIKTEKAAKHAIWGRIGWEFARSPFDFRVDNGDWTTITPEIATTDLTELSFWTEVAWYKFADTDLPAGDHTLEIRIQKQKNAKGETQRLMFGLDCLCITPNEFLPNGKFPPGQDGRTEKDIAASRVVFVVPEKPADASRTTTPLNGTWEICRDDEPLPGPVAEPIKAPPAHPFFRAIEVPGDKNTLRDDLVFAHRVWYHTLVNIPPSKIGRSHFIDFPQNNLNTTVFVNGQLCGFQKHPYVHFQIDITKAIRPGVNELWVGIRDAYYGYAASPTNPMKLRRHFNLPLQFTQNGFQDLQYPVWHAFQSGILITPSIVTAGQAYVSDVFVKPSVAKKELALELTLTNPTDKDLSAELSCEADTWKTGTSIVSISARSSKMLQLAQKWENPSLWWPDAPHMYTLRTTLKINNQNVDISNTPFGFREWGISGKNFTLNGQPWHGWNMGIPGSTKEQWLANYRKFNQTQMRMAGAAQGGNRPFFGMSPDDALDWCDQNGVVVRRCGPLDGEAIGYMAIENDSELKKLYNSEINIPLHTEWREQMVAQVKGERNHPSIQIWSTENEWLYINCINLYGSLMDKFEAQAKKVADAVAEVDPTRPSMTDGGGANKANDMPVHGNHYVALSDFTKYPALAYQPFPEGGGRGRWTWDQKRPRYLGEDFFYTGNHPELSTIGGEIAFGGKASTLQACGLMLSILQQGYRWADYGAWDFYCGDNDADGSQWKYMAPRVVLCREWDWTFSSGQQLKRHLALFNDSHDPHPIQFAWTVGQSAGMKQLTVPPGTREEFDLVFTLPKVAQRTELILTLTLAINAQQIWSDTKNISILPSPANPAAQLHLFDPNGSTQAFLKSRNIPFTLLADLKSLPNDGKLLLIGKDALDPSESTSSHLAAYASAGRAVIILEQKNPLKYQAIPAEIETATNEGRVAFPENPDHPVFKGLVAKDFFTWAPDEILYRNAYLKPTRGAKSLLQCGHLLANSALVEVPTGKGLLLLSQLSLGEKIEGNIVAQTLLTNLINYASAYKQTFRPVFTATLPNSQLSKTLDTLGLQFSKSDGPLAAIATPNSIAIIEATPENLNLLADNLPKLETFTQSGGFILFNNLTPDGLASYNRIVGFDHMIRPFGSTKPTQTKDGPMTIERVGFPAVRDSLTAGITTGDIAMYASKRIFPWTDGNYWSPDEFSYIIDYDEVAPFATSPFFAFGNIVNNFTSADGWPLIINFPLAADLSPYNIPLTFPKPQTITEFTWIGNTNYWAQTRVNLIFDNDPSKPVTFDTIPTADAQTFAVNPPRAAKEITLQIAGWQEKANSKPLVGIDNIYLKAQRPPEFYANVKPMLNIGGMMHYVRSPGGIILCNLKLMEREEFAPNAQKKQAILSNLLRNLDAPFAGGKSIIAGANLEYTPIDLSKQANQFRDEKGWFGDKNTTFKDLPTGNQKLAGVLYNIYEFPTSPVPTVIMLEGPGNKLPAKVEGIPVNRKADALFFLQAAKINRRPSDQDRRQNRKLELCHYTIHYADGQSAILPIYAAIDIDNYKQPGQPRPLPGAQLAWTTPYPNNQSAAAYSKQWTNPHPEMPITTVDLELPKDRIGTPALISLTAASAP